jgi:hypothetical protein
MMVFFLQKQRVIFHHLVSILFYTYLTYGSTIRFCCIIPYLYPLNNSMNLLEMFLIQQYFC